MYIATLEPVADPGAPDAAPLVPRTAIAYPHFSKVACPFKAAAENSKAAGKSAAGSTACAGPLTLEGGCPVFRMAHNADIEQSQFFGVGFCGAGGRT